MKTRLRAAISTIVWLTMIGIPAAQTGLPKGTQLNPGRTSAGNGNVIVIGCVSRRGEGAAAAFIISDPRPKPPAQYRLEGDAELLSMHVGHTVEVGGPVTSATAGPGGGANAAVPTLKVQSLTYISTSCASPQK
jgi:hypothetical protein